VHAILALTAATLALPVVLAAQEPPRLRYAGTSFGYSWYASRGPRWGSIVNRNLYQASIGRDRVIAKSQGPAGTLWHTVEYPLSIVTRTSAQTEHCYVTPRAGGAVCENDASANATLGVGVVPLGLMWRSSIPEELQFHAKAAVGAMVFTEPTPIARSRRFNFVLEAGGGLTFDRGDKGDVQIGYKLLHLSNAKTASVNPGLDNNVLYVALRRRVTGTATRAP
jgi:hypothetical protein